MYTCWYCGNQVAWVGDFMESEIDGRYPEEEQQEQEVRYDRVVQYCKCPYCGSDYEFRQGPSCPEEEIKQISHIEPCQ